MPECLPGNLTQRVCDLETAVSETLAGSGHPPATLTNVGTVFAWNGTTQVGNIPVITYPTIPDPEVVVVANDAARFALAPDKLDQLLIQTTDAVNGNLSIWAANGLGAGAWTIKAAGMASQNPSAVAITGGTVVGITDLAVVDGGTGASTPAAARVNLKNASVAIAALNIDWAAGDSHYKTINANTVFTFSNAADGLAIMVAVASTGAYSVTWPAGVKWTAATTPTHSGNGKTDVYSIVQINGVLYGSVVQNFTT